MTPDDLRTLIDDAVIGDTEATRLIGFYSSLAELIIEAHCIESGVKKHNIADDPTPDVRCLTQSVNGIQEV